MSKQFSKALTAAVWKHAPSRYRGAELVVLLKIAGLTTDEGFAFPGTKHLTDACGIGERNLRKITKKLKRDGILKTCGRKGRSNRYYLQLEALQALPLAVPGDEPAQEAQAPVTPAQPTPQPVTDDGASLAKRLHHSITQKIPEATVPDDWSTTWTAAMQSLLDAGHTSELIRAVARFALAHEGWSTTLLGPRGAVGLCEKFELILKQWNESEQKKVA